MSADLTILLKDSRGEGILSIIHALSSSQDVFIHTHKKSALLSDRICFIIFAFNEARNITLQGLTSSISCSCSYIDI